MPVACCNRRGFSAEKESHSLRHQEPVIKPITGSFLFPKRAIPCSFTFSERKSSVLPNINRSPPAFEVAALRQSKPCLHRLRRSDLGLVIQVGVDVRRGGKVAVPQPLLNVFEGDAVGQQQAGTAKQSILAHPHLPIHYISQCAHYGIIFVLILKKRGIGILRFQIAVLSRCSEGLGENAFHKNLRI